MIMRTEIVSTSSRMAEVGPAWDALWKRGGENVFQSHGWIGAWWNSKPTDDLTRLCVGLCWVEDDLVAVMPFTTRRHRGIRVLEWAAKDCCDYCDALVDPDFTESLRALEQVWAAVAASGGFDLAYLSHVRPDAAVRNLLDGQRKGMTFRPGHRSARSLQVRNDGLDGASWFRGLDTKARDGHARAMRIVGETGPVAARVSEPGNATDAVLERMIVLKQQWLANTGQSSTILDRNALTLRALVKELVRQQALQVFSIHCGDRLVAALLNIAAGARAQAFLVAHDPQFDHASPETLVLVEYVVKAFDMGIMEVDLLCVEEEHKFTFAKARVDLVSYVGARTLIGTLALSIGERLDRRRG